MPGSAWRMCCLARSGRRSDEKTGEVVLGQKKRGLGLADVILG